MSYIRWRRIVASTESTIEIGEITKPNIECHRADAAVAKSRVAQHPVRARKSLAEDKVGEGELFAFEKLMQVTRRHPLPLRDCGGGQIAVAEIRCYVGHDRTQPRGTNAASLSDCVAVSCGADGKRDEIVNVGCDKSLELGRVHRLWFLRDRAGITNKQFNRLRVRRDQADQSVVDATGEWCNSLARYPKTQEVHRRRMDEVDDVRAARHQHRVPI